METTEITSYSIHSMGQVVGVRDARSPTEALLEYLLAQGYRHDEIVTAGPDALSWRGAVFTAEPMNAPETTPQPWR